jgi:hypothetical protein
MKSHACILIRFFLLAGVVCTTALSTSTQGQTKHSPALLLPAATHVRGQVVGEDGEPVAKVRLYHINQSGDIVSDSNGRFDFMTSAPSFVAQRPGFQSVLVHTRHSSELHIVLSKSLHPDFPVCPNADLSDRVSGWRGVFQIPKGDSVEATHEVLDVDYWSRKITVKTSSSVGQAVQGRGPMWGGGDPEDELVWRSNRYNEVTYDLAGRLLTDARGSLPNGKCWRTVGVFSESVGYSDVNCELVQPLDLLLDGLCAVPNASKHLFP